MIMGLLIKSKDWTLPKFNTNTNDKICFMYEDAKLWNSISTRIKAIENISEFKTLLKKIQKNSLHM